MAGSGRSSAVVEVASRWVAGGDGAAVAGRGRRIPAPGGPRVDRRAHRGDVLGRRPAAAADDRGPGVQEARDHPHRGTRGSPRRRTGPRSRCGSPALGMIERGPAGRPSPSSASRQTCGPAAAVDADDVDVERRRAPRPPIAGRRAVRQVELLAEGQQRDDRQVAAAGAPPRWRSRGGRATRRSRTGTGRRRPRAGRRSARGTRPGPWRRPRWTRSLVGAPSGPTDPATRTSRPLTSRASRAIWAPRRASRPAWSARPYGARRTRLAPNVAVSIRSAPAARYSRWIAPISSGRDRTSSSSVGALRDAAREEQRAHRAVGQQRSRRPDVPEPGARIHARTIADAP